MGFPEGKILTIDTVLKQTNTIKNHKIQPLQGPRNHTAQGVIPGDKV